MSVGTLIVDDEEDIRLLLRMTIEAANEGLFVAGEAADGAEAIERADQVEPTIVVLDQRMPGMTGLETAAELMARRPGQRIVLCSAYLDPELQRAATTMGISACVGKGDIPRIAETLKQLASSA
jgi:YesN/AraC family two-component response regulator